MSISKPYYRIFRPGAVTSFIADSRYCNEVNNMHRSLKLLEYDLKQIFQFIEPHDENLGVFSNRLYELLLRACTEFEANAKAILIANGYIPKGNFEIKDYRKLNNATKLSEYEVTIHYWNPSPKVLIPFSSWKHTHCLKWFQAYNDVKHNRLSQFNNASLDNVINALAGVYTILYAQIDFHADIGLFKPGFTTMLSIDADNVSTNPMINDSIITIKRPSTWDNNSRYQFDWNALKQEAEPFQKFNFNI